MASSASRAYEVCPHYSLAMSRRERMHRSKYHGEQQTKDHQTWCELRHGDELSESIARR